MQPMNNTSSAASDAMAFIRRIPSMSWAQLGLVAGAAILAVAVVSDFGPKLFKHLFVSAIIGVVVGFAITILWPDQGLAVSGPASAGAAGAKFIYAAIRGQLS